MTDYSACPDDFGALVLAVARALGIQITACGAPAGPYSRDWNPATSDADAADLRRRMVAEGWGCIVQTNPANGTICSFTKPPFICLSREHADERIAILLAAARALGCTEVEG